jgi:transcriptional regulator
VYLPKYFEETRVAVLHDLVKSHPFAPLVAVGPSGLIVNHIPFLLDPTRGEFGTLRAHVARANPVWQQISTTSESVVIFQGPHAYISPTWYPSKHEHGKAVPTWGYAVVHAHGVPSVVEDGAWLLDLVTELSAVHESSQALPWQVSDAPKEYIDRLVERIVGIEIPIARLVGKWKVDQPRSQADKLGAVAGLTSRNTDDARAVAALIMQTLAK